MASPQLSRNRDPIKPWFEALESTGEFIGIRFGHLAPGADEPTWTYLPHSEYDGIGGFAHLIRKSGFAFPDLPQTPHAAVRSWIPFFKLVPRLLAPRRRHAWGALSPDSREPGTNQPAPAVAWHVFGEAETAALRASAKREDVTLNSLLLKQLDLALRPDLVDPDATLPWMVPVNLRGPVRRDTDTANHTSYICLKIDRLERAAGVHRKIYQAIERGEHWGPWMAYSATQFLPRASKRLAIKTDRAIAQWNLGGFSNLGVWDADQCIKDPALAGSWLFSPPVLRCQMVGAGCMTFQGKLSLLVQAHPELTTSPEVPARWLTRWVDLLEGRQEAGAGHDPEEVAPVSRTPS